MSGLMTEAEAFAYGAEIGKPSLSFAAFAGRLDEMREAFRARHARELTAALLPIQPGGLFTRRPVHREVDRIARETARARMGAA